MDSGGNGTATKAAKVAFEIAERAGGQLPMCRPNACQTLRKGNSGRARGSTQEHIIPV